MSSSGRKPRFPGGRFGADWTAGLRRRATSLDLVQFPLVGSQVELRPFTLGDVPAAHLVYRDPEVMRYVGHGAVRGMAGAESMVRQYMAHQRTHGFGFWAVVDRPTGVVIGDAGLARTADGEVEMGYTLARAWWGRGIATEAAGMCVEAARGPLGLPRLRSLVEEPNLASRRVLEKLGFERDGVTIAFDREHLVYRLNL